MSLSDYDREVQNNTEMSLAHDRKGIYSNPLWDKNPLESIGKIKEDTKKVEKIHKELVEELKEIDDGKRTK